MLALDQMLPADDEARTVVAFVEQCDLTELYDSIRAVEGQAGRAPANPQILLSLWLYATIKGIGSTWEVNRPCQWHLGFQWICGDVTMNYHALSDFRVDHGAMLDRLLTEHVTTLKETVLINTAQKDPAATSRRQQAARERAAREREPHVRMRCRASEA